MPTRIMPPPPQGWGAGSGARTAPTPRQETSPVYDPSGGYQPSVPPMHPSVIPPYTPPRKRTPVGWILAFIGMGLFVLVVVGVMMIARFGRARINGSGSTTTTQSRQGETVLNESTADTVSALGNDTILTKTFVLGGGAKLSLKNANGNITVTAWDQPKAEVKVIRRGSSDRAAQVFFSDSGGNLSIRTGQNRGNQDVRFEVKIPRELSRVDVSSANGMIKLSDVRAEILVDGTNGAIELIGVVGVSRVHTTNGSIKASLLEASDRGMEFESTNGGIDLTVPPGFEADLEAATVHGTINIEDSLGVEVEKGIVGQKARGEIGQGGERLKLATVNGNIRLATAEPSAKESAKGKKNGN
ncbi:MAG TPA: DUF4097 family beta strand repeat-containing protein [Blastocatellia bacterium]|nr:DUF4097 family beta strand repeat-containing protein [Blastocatellia bacterium]